MDTKIMQRFRENLRRQGQNLRDWLNNTPARKKQIRLGPADEEAVHTHLRVIDTALAKAENQTFEHVDGELAGVAPHSRTGK